MAAFEQYINDKYLSAIHSPILAQYMPMTHDNKDKFELAALTDATLLDFVSSVPAPVTQFLVHFGPLISTLKTVARAASWKGPADQSFLLLFSWWAVCLFGSIFIRFAVIPLLFLGPLLVPHLPKRFTKATVTPTTEIALANALSDLDVIYKLTPTVAVHDILPPGYTLRERLRFLGYALPPWIALTFWVPVRVLVALGGSWILINRSPWYNASKNIVTRSAYIRAAWRALLGWISGNYDIPLATFTQKNIKPDSIKIEQGQIVKTHRFMFTILENQRWWVGIDWTAALLPSERPSWCAPIETIPVTGNQTAQPANYVPLQPPSSFPLPPDSSVVLPAAVGEGYVRRSAHWTWEENGEWEVLVHKEGETSVKKFRPPVLKPPLKSPTQISGGTEDADPKGSSLAKTVSKLRAASSASPTRDSSGDTAVEGELSEKVEEEFTDTEGWIYGDNKWENASAKGGIGKFTRFRRWCRIAVLVETEEPCDDPDAKPSFTQIVDSKAAALKDGRPGNDSTTTLTQSVKEAKGSPERGRSRAPDSVVLDSPPDTALRQRLKAAFNKTNVQ